MSYSYKPVLIMAIVEHGGVLRIDEAVDYFIKYYGQRNVGLSMILDSERGKPFSGRKPSERAHGTGVGATLVCS